MSLLERIVVFCDEGLAKVSSYPGHKYDKFYFLYRFNTDAGTSNHLMFKKTRRGEYASIALKNYLTAVTFALLRGYRSLAESRLEDAAICAYELFNLSQDSAWLEQAYILKKRRADLSILREPHFAVRDYKNAAKYALELVGYNQKSAPALSEDLQAKAYETAIQWLDKAYECANSARYTIISQSERIRDFNMSLLGVNFLFARISRVYFELTSNPDRLKEHIDHLKSCIELSKRPCATIDTNFTSQLTLFLQSEEAKYALIKSRAS